MIDTNLYVLGAIFLPLFLYLLRKLEHIERTLLEVSISLKEVGKWIKGK